MDAIQLQILSEQLRSVREKAEEMYYLQHPVRYNDYEITAMLNDLGAVVRNGSNIHRTVTFPPTAQHELNADLIKAYCAHADARMTELLHTAKELHPREITNILMQYTSDLLAYKPQIKLVFDEGENDG